MARMYLVIPAEGSLTLPAHETVETVARRAAHAVGGTVEPVEVPTTKPELKEYLNKLVGRFAARFAFSPSEAISESPPCREGPYPKPEAEVSSELPSIEAIQNAGVDEVTHILEAALERFAELGEPARESLESRVSAFNFCGAGQPSQFFQRAAMTLAILALGEISGLRTTTRKTWGAGK